jgi:putative DNA methylase
VPEPYRKKLIEVALPLDAINRESQHEKSVPRRGHPATMHLWWARRPLAACRAVLFASLIDDPSSSPDRFPSERDQEAERQRLFGLIERLVRWENTTDDAVLTAARKEIEQATNGKPPVVVDPFCGGGSIPLEAQRLGLATLATDLNPVAVLITRALIGLPTRFAGEAPINPESRGMLGRDGSWRGAQGLAADVRHYGDRIRQRVREEIGSAYPKIEAPDLGPIDVTGWVWARTAPCSNPACRGTTPLVRSFALSTRRGSEARIEPDVDYEQKTVTFTVQRDSRDPYPGLKVGRGANFKCIFCGNLLDAEYVKEVGKTRGYGLRLLAVIGEGRRNRRTYLSPTEEQETTALSAVPKWLPETPLPDQALGFRVQGYGFRQQADLYTTRQQLAITTFVDQTREIKAQVLADARAAGVEDATHYADAVITYLSFAISKMADWCNAFCTFIPSTEQVGHLFSEQKISMVWDFFETNPLSSSVGNYGNHVEWVARTVEVLPASLPATVRQLDARAVGDVVDSKALVATDPPYDDNIGYADLSDFFYTWLRPILGDIYSDDFSTLLTPKGQEIIAAAHLFEGDEARARTAFQEGLRAAFAQIAAVQDPEYPATIVYGLRQDEARGNGTGAGPTGWEAFLEAVLSAGLMITGTWPVRSERGARSRAIDSNALASSIVLVCRPAYADAPVTTRRDFLSRLRNELPDALKALQHGNIAPVDLAQASIGPGMAIFSSYAKVVEADGQPMTVRAALAMVNQALDEILTKQEGDFDADTRFAVTWFEQRGTDEGPFGEADVLARAKNTAVAGLVEAGVLSSHGGKVRLLRRAELDPDWDPSTDRRLTVWEVTQHLIRRLEEGGEDAAAALLRRVGGLGETARELAYRLFSICERKGWAQEALGYNALVIAWPEIARQVAGTPESDAQQALEV